MTPVPHGCYTNHLVDEILTVAQTYTDFPPEATVFPTRTTGFVAAGPIPRTPQVDVYMDEFMFQVEESIPEGLHMVKVFVGENGVHEVTGICHMSNRRTSLLHTYAEFNPDLPTQSNLAVLEETDDHSESSN